MSVGTDPYDDMSEAVRGHLHSISRLSTRIHEYTGRRPPYMPITQKFVTLLAQEGFIPAFDHVEGYGLCWVWMIWQGLQIVSAID